MNKKEVSMFLTGVTGRLLCVQLLDFHKWAQERLDRNIDLDVFGMIVPAVSEEIKKTITDAEWQEIANFFIVSEGSGKAKKMNKERTKVGDIRISKMTKKPIICTGVEYDATGNEDSTWTSYEKNLLRTRMGMSPESHQLHPLQHFVDTLNANQLIQQKDTIKIRYAYITSLTNVKDDPFYKENLTFRTLTLSELETLHGPLEDLLTLDTTTLIRILGRDLYTGRVDMDGKSIYEGDIIRWFLDDGNYIDETIHQTSHFAELDTERDCKVIDTIYDKWENI